MRVVVEIHRHRVCVARPDRLPARRRSKGRHHRRKILIVDADKFCSTCVCSAISTAMPFFRRRGLFEFHGLYPRPATSVWGRLVFARALDGGAAALVGPPRTAFGHAPSALRGSTKTTRSARSQAAACGAGAGGSCGASGGRSGLGVGGTLSSKKRSIFSNSHPPLYVTGASMRAGVPFGSGRLRRPM